MIAPTTVDRPSRRRAIPLPVWVIGGAIFAQGTSELMLAGLLPEMAADLGVPIPRVSLLVSVFAVGMLIGAPVLAVATLRCPRRTSMLAFLGVFAAGHAASAVTDSFTVLLALRFVCAVVYAGFWSVAAATAMSLVPAARRGRAMSVVAGGLTLASVIGLPLGTWIGQSAGWRGAFWAVTAATLVAAATVLTLVPRTRPDEATASADQVRRLRVPRLWLSYAMTAACTAALLGSFTFLGATIVTDSGAPAGWIPVVLLGYGAGALAAMVVGGHVADRWPRGTLVVGFAALAVVLGVLAASTRSLVAVGTLAPLLGFTGFATNPALASRVFGLSEASPTLLAAGTTSAFNAGIAIGPWLAGLSLSAGHGYSSIPVIGVALAVGALLLLALDTRLAARAAVPRTRRRRTAIPAFGLPAGAPCDYRRTGDGTD